MQNTENLQDTRKAQPCLPGFLLLLCLTAALGCRSSGQAPAQSTGEYSRTSELPRIHSIGNSNILVYETDQDLVIPIKGAYFADETLIWSITVTGVAPLKQGVDYTISHPDGFSSGMNDVAAAADGAPVTPLEGDDSAKLGNERSNIIHLCLTKHYLSRVKTGDTLNIEVNIADGTEHLALERAHDNDVRVTKLLEELTAELNVPESDEQKIGAMVSGLISLLHENNDYIAKLRPGPKTKEQLAMFDKDVAAIQTFMVRRKPIPTNLRDEVRFKLRNDVQPTPVAEPKKTDDTTNLTGLPGEEDGFVDEEPKPEAVTSKTAPAPSRLAGYINDPNDIDSWGSLERRLQTIAARQRSMVSRRKAQTVRAPLLSSATRQFVLYEVKDYREKVLSARIPVHDISAYPLPGSETEKLFGKGVADMYFVVRLSIRNTTEEDQLISTGLIKAYGRALVSNGNEEGERAQFTIPVQIVPQSREHVYTIVAEGRLNSPRNIFFRGLEFTGTLTTALVGAFDPTVKSLQWASLFSGILITSADKAIPDRVPRFLSNIVNFSMPDLIKVPRNGVMGHKYLFFSKGDLQAMISDTKYAQNAAKGSGPVVVYMAFDSLHIPFENARKPGVDPAEIVRMQATQQAVLEKERAIAKVQLDSLTEKLTSTRESLVRAEEQIDELRSTRAQQAKQQEAQEKKRKIALDEIDAALAQADKALQTHDDILTTWCKPTGARIYAPWGLAPAGFETRKKKLDALRQTKTFTGSGLPAFDKKLPIIRQVMDEWNKVFTGLSPAGVRRTITACSKALSAKKLALEAHRKQIEAGLVTELDKRILVELQSQIAASQAQIKVYGVAAGRIAAEPLTQKLSDLTDADTQNLQQEISDLIDSLKRVAGARGDTGLFPTLRPPLNDGK